LRTAKCTVVIALLGLAAVHCGGGSDKKEAPDPFAAMKKNKFVRIATDAVNLPFEFGSGTGVQGFDVDLGEEIGKDLGYTVKWIKSPFEKLFDLVRNGEVEMAISAISITTERKKDFAFSDPYYASGNTIAHRKDKLEIKDLASLKDKKVGVQSSATGQIFMEGQKNLNATLVKFPTLDDALGALNRTEIDAVVGDEPILTYSMAKSFQNLATTGAKLTQEDYGVLLRKTDKELVAKVNATIARLKKSNALEDMRKKWFQNVLQEASAERNKMQQEEAMKGAPKAVAVSISKTGGVFRMDRLDGHVVTLSGAAGTFTSSPINTNGNHGSCTFPNPVPPGEYRISMPVLKMNATFTIPKKATKSMRLIMTIGDSVRIDVS
jgi:ABC-type amino acid transport substrate-binding protein